MGGKTSRLFTKRGLGFENEEVRARLEPGAESLDYESGAITTGPSHPQLTSLLNNFNLLFTCTSNKLYNYTVRVTVSMV